MSGFTQGHKQMLDIMPIAHAHDNYLISSSHLLEHKHISMQYIIWIIFSCKGFFSVLNHLGCALENECNISE